MNNIEIHPLKKPVSTTLTIPGSKSYTNRALVMGALSQGVVTLKHPLYSDDTEAMIGCLQTLGLHIENFPDQILIHNDISAIKNQSCELFAQESGTTLRFLVALLCLTPGIKILKGAPRLNERPIKDLVNALNSLGADIVSIHKNGQPPFNIRSSTLHLASEVNLDASTSSQFLSALLMIAPLLNGLKIRLTTKPISQPYIEMTVQMMNDWGIEVLHPEQNLYEVPAGQQYQKKIYSIEGDFSSAGYFFAIAALTQSTLTLQNLNPHSAQADLKFVKILEKMGNFITYAPQEITIRGQTILPQSICMEDCPDQVQTMAVLAAFAKGITKISGVRSLRVKETERVQALKNELAKMGIKTEDTHDTLTIYGGNPHPAKIDSYGDHRMAMAFAVAGKKMAGIEICQPEVVNKTFPTFWDELNSL